MSRVVIAAMLSVVLSLLAACATPYQSSLVGALWLGGGYSDEQLADGTWRVRFSGNTETTRETVETYWLYRSAELTLDKGYEGFSVVSGTDVTLSRNFTYSMEGRIQLIKQPFAPEPQRVYDAAALKQALTPLVNGNKCGGKGNVCPRPQDYLQAPR
jgi:hypothetical protein